MAVSDFQSLMLPTLKALAVGGEVRISDLRERVAAAEGLTPEDLREMLSSGNQTRFANRVSWVTTYLGAAGLIENVRRGVYRLTSDGEALLDDPPSRIDSNYLRRYPAFAQWKSGRKRKRRDAPAPPNLMDAREKVLDTLEEAARLLRASLEAEVLDRIREATPDLLEKTVVDLLVAMGYDGGAAAVGRVADGSGEGGTDGTIREDPLGLDRFCLQTKSHRNPVGADKLRDFAGVIDEAGTTKGVFVATTDFTRDAREYVARSPKRIVLIDGEGLARLMVRYGIGVRTHVRHEVKRIDEDYFDREAQAVRPMRNEGRGPPAAEGRKRAVGEEG